MSILGHLLLALAAVVVIGRLFGRVLAWCSQPPVIGDIVVPFAVGAALAVYLHPRLSTAAVPFGHFALFMGIALSITAFPVLARILEDRGMTATRLGTAALTCAAIADVVSWCLLAFVVGVVQARIESLILVAGLTLAFIAVMFFLVRPLFCRLSVGARGRSARDAVAWALAAMLLAALATETIGVHAVFGAFLLGAVSPHDGDLARSLERSLGDLATVLLPAFFALTGMRTEVGLLSSVDQWALCGVIAATAGKFGGTLATTPILRRLGPVGAWAP
ncbi:MAG: cation:proton antiporter [Acidobacteria bacterium]|nr:cation:proton antiporter [Acidobacteriota bacterium]